MNVQTDHQQPKRRVHHFAMLKQDGQKITVVTAYDYPTGLAADASGADAVLVGDSLGMVALGMDTTIPVTLDIMVHHTAAVRRAVKRAFLVADMPFLSYHGSRDICIQNAGRLIQSGGAEAVKIEGGRAIAPQIKALCDAGIPVMGHIGLLPQSVHRLGGYRVQGRDQADADALLEDAQAVQEAGAFAVVLEAMGAEAAATITDKLAIPTIGIGAGKRCGGQVLVLSDIVGMLSGSPPKFVKQYASVGCDMIRALTAFGHDVRNGKFPEDAHEY